ncbi:MAG TPA: M28 family metallopeptidase [Thermoleophilaceae bacterium]|nr:M28 family metallopeptidase [Thermoleophilaceae bacterium]
MRTTAIVLIGLGVAGLLLAVLALDGEPEPPRPDFRGASRAPVPDESPCPRGRPPAPRADRVDADRTFALLRDQVELGPRPAGSRSSRSLAEGIRRLIPNGRLDEIDARGPDRRPLRNVIGAVRGRDPVKLVVVGAHYDTKDLPGFVGANDGAAGTAAVVSLARSIRPGQLAPTVAFVFFDGEEAPAGSPSEDFERSGLRGSRAAAPGYARRGAAAMILLDFVADRNLSIPREANSTPALWEELRAAAARVGVGCAFPAATRPPIIDDHVPFLKAGVPAINLIDFTYPCWHRRCDDLSAVSRRSLDASTEAVYELLARL